MWSSLYPGLSVAGAREASQLCHQLGQLTWLPRFPSLGVTWRGYDAPCTSLWTVLDRRGNGAY
jgi:hypothetical protein